MRVVLTSPFCWPYVRRGNERFIAEFGEYLMSRGYEVIVVSSKPGHTQREPLQKGMRILHRSLWTPALGRLRLQPAHGFFLGVARTLATIDADIVHSLFHHDAWLANSCRRWRGYKSIFHLTGPPFPYAFRRLPPDRQMMKSALLRTDKLITVSEYTRRVAMEFHGVDAQVLPVPVNRTRFQPDSTLRPNRPTILAVADFNERRKGIRVLTQAFARLKDRVKDAILNISGSMSEPLQREVFGSVPDWVRRDIHMLGFGRLEDVPKLYQSASITTLPSTSEAFGMVLLESWACGTPVVATSHGALPELMTDPLLGVMFEPGPDPLEATNVDGLVEAMLTGLELSQKTESRARCLNKVSSFTWNALGPQYEKVYTTLVGL